MTICNNENCSKKATFNFKGEKAKFCMIHKEESMVDVVNKKCITCKQKQPRWNFQGLQSEFCGDCKLPGMIEPNRKLCSCNKSRPCFNFDGLKAEYCGECKSDGMINVIDKRCVCGKLTSPNFNYDGLKGRYCNDCKLDGMVDVRNPTCACKNRANFNFAGLKPKYCGTCKLDGMEDITHPKCIICKVSQSNFNYKGLTPKYCSKCKTDGMIDLYRKMCDGCGNCQPTYNFAGELPRYCLKCKTSEMVDCIHNLCKTHLCGIRVQEKYDGYCLRCYINLFPDKPVSKNYKTKEFAVIEFIKNEFANYDWQTDKQVKEGCSKRRPDLLLDLGYQVIVIEIDENQHIDYDCSCENKRLMELSQDLGHRPIVFIRFNPDEYINKDSEKIVSCWGYNKAGISIIKKTQKKEWINRLNSFQQQIQYWSCSENSTNKTVEIIQLYYNQN
jgi:hypothetical protein